MSVTQAPTGCGHIEPANESVVDHQRGLVATASGSALVADLRLDAPPARSIGQRGSGGRSRFGPAGHRAACGSHKPCPYHHTPAGSGPSAEHLRGRIGSPGSFDRHRKLLGRMRRHRPIDRIPNWSRCSATQAYLTWHPWRNEMTAASCPQIRIEGVRKTRGYSDNMPLTKPH